MSIQVLQSSWWGRESWLLCLICLPGVLWWLSGSSSRCHGVVCSFWLWYFLIILSYYFLKKNTFSQMAFIPLFHTGHESPESPRIYFLLGGGGGGGFVRFRQFIFSNRYVIRGRPDSDTMLLRIFGGNRRNSAGIAQEFITISKITLEHAARKLRNQSRISWEYAECIMSWARINRNPRQFATIREIFSHDSYKKGPYILQGISSKMNVPRKAAVELILQLECWKRLLI